MSCLGIMYDFVFMPIFVLSFLRKKCATDFKAFSIRVLVCIYWIVSDHQIEFNNIRRSISFIVVVGSTFFKYQM